MKKNLQTVFAIIALAALIFMAFIGYKINKEISKPVLEKKLPLVMDFKNLGGWDLNGGKVAALRWYYPEDSVSIAEIQKDLRKDGFYLMGSSFFEQLRNDEYLKYSINSLGLARSQIVLGQWNRPWQLKDGAYYQEIYLYDFRTNTKQSMTVRYNAKVYFKRWFLAFKLK